MSRFLVLALLFSSLLVLGCVQPPAPTGGATPTPAPTGGIATATPGATPAPTGGATATAQVSVQGGAGQPPANVLAAMALGVPYQCRVTILDKETGKTQSGDMWIKGQNYRWEAVLEGRQGLFIKRGDDLFVWMPEQSLWLQLSATATPGPTAAGPSGAVPVDTNSAEIEQSTDVQCSPAAFGDDKFATPGTVKKMDEYLQEIMRQYGGGSGGVPTVPSG